MFPTQYTGPPSTGWLQKAFWDKRPVSIDFYNNYMTNFHDNPFETDGSLHNVRVMRNMMINSAHRTPSATSRCSVVPCIGSGTSPITCPEARRD